MHAFIITGSGKTERLNWTRDKLNEWKISAFDQIRIVAGASAIGISEVRRLGKQLALRPLHSLHSVGIIEDAHLLTLEAQQALLKTLEEPPPHAFILCELANAEMLLATVQSRCQIIQLVRPLREPATEINLEDLRIAMGLSLGEKLSYVDSRMKGREDAQRWTDNAIETLRSQLRQQCTQKEVHTKELSFLAMTLRKALRIYRDLASNISPKTAVDRFLLSI